jgi:hypothetical protein
MISIQISRAARLAAVAQLGAAFNANLTQASTDFDVAPFTIDFAGGQDEGCSFVQVKLTREDLFKLLKPSTTCMAVWSDELEDHNIQHPNTFSGPVMVVGEVHRWIAVSGLADLANGEDYLDAIKSALIETFNGPASEVNGAGIQYNHAIRIENTEWAFFQDGVIATVHFQLTFEVTAS